jgi:hypothetical protein
VSGVGKGVAGVQTPLLGRGRRLAAILAGLVVLAGPAGAAHADTLVTALAGDLRPGTALPLAAPASPVAFRSRRGDEEEVKDEAAAPDPMQTLELLAALLAIPCGCTPVYNNTNVHTSSVPNSPGSGGGNSSNTNPGGDGPGGSDGPPPDLAPEPGSLVTGLIGAGLIGLPVLGRKRRLRLAC